MINAWLFLGDRRIEREMAREVTSVAIGAQGSGDTIKDHVQKLEDQ
jgi:hypothetical protein